MTAQDAAPTNARTDPPPSPRSWKFLTNHGHVLLGVALDPDVLVQDLARTVGITTRATMLILKDLEDAGYVHRERVGRRTHYTVHRHQPFRHPTAADHPVDELIAVFAEARTPPRRTRST